MIGRRRGAWGGGAWATSVFVAVCGLVAACGSLGPRDGPSGTTVSSAGTTGTFAGSGATTTAASVSATSAASGAPSASAEAGEAPEVLPPRMPDAERPSAKATAPAGVDAAQWTRMLETYGRLLDLDPVLDDYHRDHPDKTEIVTLATTHEGRAVRAMLIADKPSRAKGRPAMLLNGAHHGDEPLSALMMLDAIDTLLSGDKDPKIARVLSELAVWVVPMVNRDGFALFMRDLASGRKNGRETRKAGDRSPVRARGVDLNRNYPFRWGATNEVGSSKNPNRRSYRGLSPASEPETRAMVELSDRLHFVGSISYHTGTLALLAPYTIDGVPVPKPNEAWLVAEDVARAIPKLDKRPVYVRKNLYTVDGTDQDYHRFAHGTLALLLESAAKSWDTPALAKKAIVQIRHSWRALFDRYLDGPSVEGRVKDEAGHAVSAKVEIAEVVTLAGEEWRSRCSDGFYGRYLPGYGKFTVRVTPPGGGAPIEKKVDSVAGKGRVTVDFVVPGTSGGGACPAAKVK